MEQQVPAPPPPVQLLQMLMGMWVAQIASAFARLGAADAIAAGNTSADAIARSADASADGTYRLLRAAATAGLVRETSPREFALTPLGECLREGAPGSLRDFVIAETAPGHWLPWGRLYDAVKRGSSVASETLGVDVWEYYAKNAEEGHAFARGMGNLSALVSQQIGGLYDASRFRRIVDVGGSQGVLLAGLLASSPEARGVLFDRDDVIAEARHVVESGPLRDRIEMVAGDFFANVPEGGDLYVLKSILHDWPDERCAAILANVHRAAAPHSRLLVVETILPDEPQPSPVAFMDLNMLVMLNGRERTVSEYTALLRDAGYEVERFIPTGGMFGLIEARRL
jgi:hypothetical protein